MNHKFKTKAKWHISRKAEDSEIYELAKEYNVTQEEVTVFLEEERREKALALALNPISPAQLKHIYNTLDKRFVEKYPDIVSYTRGDNVSFYKYENGVYNEVNQNKMENLVDWLMEELNLLEYRATRSRVKDTILRIGSLLSRTPKRHFNDSVKSKYLLNLKNGLLDMKTYELQKHTPDYFSTSQVPFEYDPCARCPKFDDFIKLVSNQDTSTAEMIQEMYGYCIGDGNPQHKIFYLYGKVARNGKSTTAKLLCHLLGQDNYSTLSLEQLSNDNSPHLLNLIGKQLNFSDETTSNFIDSSSLTSMSAEGTIQVNPKYKPPYAHHVTNKFIVACNDLPRFKNGQGMKHRMISISFDYHIPPQDRIARYEEMLLKEEGSGILNWAIKGAKSLKQKGDFSINAKSIEDMRENTKENNSAFAFFDENYDDKFENTKPLLDVFDAYESYCMDRRLGVLGYNKFVKEARRYAEEEKLFEIVKKNNGMTIVGLGKSF